MNDKAIKITPQFILEIIIRRRWLILLPLSIALMAGIALAILLPKTYEAQTLILVEAQRVPEDYVQSIVTDDPSQRITTISQQILSRTNLEKIIRDFGLFNDPKSRNLFMEEKIENLRKRISVDVITGKSRRGEAEAFTIKFSDQDPEKVMRVANGLAAYFIDENLRSRESQAAGTSEFLDSELNSMRLRLEQFEEKIKDYRKTNMGELPEQLDANLRIVDRLQENLSNREQSLRDAKIRLSDLNGQAASASGAALVIGNQQGTDIGGGSLEQLQETLKSLQSRYTDKHPDIQRLKKQIAEMEKNQAGESGKEAVTGTRIPAALRAEIDDVKREIQLLESDVQSLNAQIAEYQKRIENTPKREQELLDLKRDYEKVQATYESLLSRKLEADIAVNMERKQKGEQFRVIDPARVPQKPAKPDMKKLFLAVLAAGFAVGAGFIYLLEFATGAFLKPADIEAYYELPVLTIVPQILKPNALLLRRINAVFSIAYSVFVVGLLGLFTFLCLKGTGSVPTILKTMIVS